MKLHRKRKGQSTVEYAIVLGVIVGALIAMQTYVKRGLQAKYRDTTLFMTQELNGVNGFNYATQQYEPYYLVSQYSSWSNSSVVENVTARGATNKTGIASSTDRNAGGYQESQSGTMNSGF